MSALTADALEAALADQTARASIVVRFDGRWEGGAAAQKVHNPLVPSRRVAFCAPRRPPRLQTRPPPPPSTPSPERALFDSMESMRVLGAGRGADGSERDVAAPLRRAEGEGGSAWPCFGAGLKNRPPPPFPPPLLQTSPTTPAHHASRAHALAASGALERAVHDFGAALRGVRAAAAGAGGADEAILSVSRSAVLAR